MPTRTTTAEQARIENLEDMVVQLGAWAAEGQLIGDEDYERLKQLRDECRRDAPWEDTTDASERDVRGTVVDALLAAENALEQTHLFLTRGEPSPDAMVLNSVTEGARRECLQALQALDFRVDE